jgi:hypothetical protein
LLFPIPPAFFTARWPGCYGIVVAFPFVFQDEGKEAAGTRGTNQHDPPFLSLQQEKVTVTDFLGLLRGNAVTGNMRHVPVIPVEATKMDHGNLL